MRLNNPNLIGEFSPPSLLFPVRLCDFLLPPWPASLSLFLSLVLLSVARILSAFRLSSAAVVCFSYAFVIGGFFAASSHSLPLFCLHSRCRVLFVSANLNMLVALVQREQVCSLGMRDSGEQMLLRTEHHVLLSRLITLVV